MKLSCAVYLFTVLMFSASVQALVDYADSNESDPGPAKAVRTAPTQMVKRDNPNRGGGSSSASGMFNLGVGIKTTEVQVQDTQGKLSTVAVDGRFQTSYDLFLDFSYWGAASGDHSLAQKSQYQKGNPKVLLGINFLNYGNESEKAGVDLYGGMILKENASEFAHTKNDQVFGIELTKRFYEFILGLGYEFRLTGKPAYFDQMETGNIQHMTGMLGLRISPDINFGVQVGMYKIANANKSDREFKLQEELSFSYLRPVLELQLGSSMLKAELGGVFRTKRLGDQSLLKARLWDLQGSYGNSLFANLTAGL